MKINQLYKQFKKIQQGIKPPTSKVEKKTTKVPTSKKGLWDKKLNKVIVPSNRITMKGPNGEKDFFEKPVLGKGLQTGRTILMEPGKEYNFPGDKQVVETRLQNGAIVKPSRREIYQEAEKEFERQEQYMQSPEYSRLLQTEFYGPNSEDKNVQPMIEARKENLSGLRVDVPYMSFMDFSDGDIAKYDPNYHQIKLKKDTYDKSALRHEMSHALDSSYNPGADTVGDYFSNIIREDLSSKGKDPKDPTTQYITDPTEVKARLKALRDSSIDQGYRILEPGYNIENYKKGFSPLENQQYKQLKDVGFTDEDINKYMYLFAKQDIAETKIAQDGAEISDLPIDIDALYSRFKKDTKSYMQEGGSMPRPSVEVDPEMMFRDKYNTQLSSKEQKQFESWVDKESKRQGRDILMDMGAYDVKGFWKSGDYKRMDSDNHGSDKWKKPNHPTFSNQSKYHGADGWYGGNWTDKAGYQPSKQTLEAYGPDYYNEMFQSEPGRSEYLDMSRYESGQNTPTPFMYQKGGETSTEQNPTRMSPIDISVKRPSWYTRNIERPLERWGRSYAQRISDATGGSEWYKQPNSVASAFFSTGPGFALEAPQLTATYAATGKVQTPSEAMDIQNPYGAFAVDALLDPATALAAGSRTLKGIGNFALGKLEEPIIKQINKNPKLALSLQNRRPIQSIDNVTISPGLQQGDVKSIYGSPYQLEKSQQGKISEINFFKGLNKGTESLDNSLRKRIEDLSSAEGFNRLVNQEKEWLLQQGQDPSVAERVAKLNARARIEELKNTSNINKDAFKYSEENLLIGDNEFVKDKLLYDNAYFSPTYNLKWGKSTYDKIKYIMATKNPNYSKPQPGGIAMGYNFVNNKPVEMHEIAHALQRSRILPIDNELRQITPKKQLGPTDQVKYDYFNVGSQGQEASAFANELRESMFQKGFIPDYYSPITETQVQDAYKYFKKNPIGVYDPKDGTFLSNTRIFDFMEPTKANSKILTDVLNKLPAAAPVGIGLGASQIPNQKSEMQMGGMSIPGVNGTVVSTGSLYNKNKKQFKKGGQHGGLDRWFAEKWVDVKTGKTCGRQEGENRAYPACRPSKRISSKTPKTSSEMSSAEKAKFKSTKTSSQRIPYNHKRK